LPVVVVVVVPPPVPLAVADLVVVDRVLFPETVVLELRFRAVVVVEYLMPAVLQQVAPVVRV
jgi:hypothetical protein